MSVRLRRAQTKRFAVLAATVVVTAGALPAMLADAADAEETVDMSTVTALAVASGQRASVFTTGLQAVSDFFDGVGPVAESRFDGFGGGQSFASLPYPGTTLVQYPAYVALATGETAPPYPFYVAADPGAPEAKMSDPTGTYALEATADREAAASFARLRGPGGEALEAGTLSTTSIKIDNGKLVATAESLTDGLSVGGTLRIASIYSKSVTTYGPGAQPPVTTTELRVDGGAVNDQRFGFGPDGLTVTEQGVPVPVAQGLDVLNAVLGQDGISIRFLAPEEITGGAQAETLEISLTRNLPGGGSGVLSMRFGQATSAVVPGGQELLPVTPEIPEPSSDASPPPPDQSSSAPPDASETLTAPPSFPASDFGSSAAPEVDLFGPASSAGVGQTDFGPGDFGVFAPEGAAGDPAASGDGTGSLPEETALAPPASTPDPNTRQGQLATSAVDLRAVDGVYAAVAWATIAVLALSLIWRRGARQWTS